MVQVLLVATAAFFGAGARLFVIERVGRRYDAVFPYALLVANLSGSFAIGVIATLITERFNGNRDASLLLVTGFLGAFTTFFEFQLRHDPYARKRSDATSSRQHGHQPGRRNRAGACRRTARAGGVLMSPKIDPVMARYLAVGAGGAVEHSFASA
ncbi:MAG: CrcB family protein [Thermomicrobiales bacterium]